MTDRPPSTDPTLVDQPLPRPASERTMLDATPEYIRSRTVANRPTSDRLVPQPSGKPVIPDASIDKVLDPTTPGGERYAVGELLGTGSSSHVYAGHDRTFDREVAIKFLETGLAQDVRRLSRFVREARMTACLDHPNIVPVYDLNATPAGDLYLTMRQVKGLSLGDAVRRAADGDLAPELGDVNRRVNILLKVCDALTCAHDRGIAHLDVKPDNIMLGQFGEVVLVDWGLARRFDEASRARQNLTGTPAYMSPEQCVGHPGDALADVYCLGATLFHVLTLRHPTWGIGEDEFWTKKRAGIIDPPTAKERARIPEQLLAIALKAMAVQREDRYQSVKALSDDLQSYQAGLTVGAWREPLWHLLRRWYRQHRAQTWTVAVALLLVMTAGGLWWREKQREHADWRLVLNEDFSDPAEVSKRWRVVAMTHGQPLGEPQEAKLADDSRVRIADGRLELGDHGWVVNTALRDRIYGNLRAEWDCTPLWSDGNINCFIGDDRTKGYIFHVGGYGNPNLVFLTQGHSDTVLAAARLTQPVVKGQTYHFQVERDGGRLRLSIDGRLLIDHEDPVDASAVAPQAVGFDTWSGCRLAISAVRLWTKALPERISPLEVAEQLSQEGRSAAALRQYRNLASAYAGQPLGIEAEFRAGSEALRAGEVVVGKAALRRLVSVYPTHRLAPHALYFLLAEAQKRGDAQEMENYRESLAAFPGDPLQRRVLLELGSEYIALMARNDPQLFDRPLYPADALAKVEAALVELARWSRRYGQPVEVNRLIEVAGDAMIHAGRGDLILALWPDKAPARARALLEMGRAAEVLESFSHLDHERNCALLVLGRLDELVRSEESWSRLALLIRGDVDGLCRLFPYSDETAQALINNLRAAEVASEAKYSPLWRGWGLLALGKPEEAIKLPTTDHAFRANALVALGREEDALATCTGRSFSGPLVQLARLRRGDTAGAQELVARCRQGGVEHQSVYGMLAYHLIPALMRHDAGDRAGCTALLDAALEDGRWCNGLQFWHLVAYATGRIDEVAFAKQPNNQAAVSNLRLAQALRADLAGDRVAAHSLWSTVDIVDDEMPACMMVKEFARWRSVVTSR